MMNFHLTLIFVLISIRFLSNGFFLLGYLDFLKDYYSNYSKFLILIIPSFYLYFKNLIADEKLFIKKDLVHFIFPLVFLVFNIVIVNTNDLLPAAFYFISRSVLFLYNIAYCFLAYSLLNKNVWFPKGVAVIQNKYSGLIKKWTLFLFIILLINSTKLFTTLFQQDHYLHIFVDDIRLQGVGAIVWIFTFFKVLISPEILYGYTIYSDATNEINSPNTALDTDWNIEFNKESRNSQDRKLKEKIDKNIIHYIVEIENVSKEFEVFGDSKFSLSDLALKLNIPYSNLNYLFKYHSKISFSDYKKKVRIHRSIHLMKSDYLKTRTLNTLAQEVGFASYNPFFTSFKSIIGISPQKYIDKLNEV